MPNKYQLVNEMANDTLKEVTSSSENWIKFLDTASRNYKYAFNEQILIYAQKPNATACADIETWNKRLKRWVNKGAKGIALISIENGRNILRHVFDISDTHSGIKQELKLWEVKPSYENGLIETLENSFGNLQIKDNLAEAIFSSSSNLVEDNFQDYLVDLKEVVENSSLQGLSDIDLESIFKGILVNSISYMVMKRCGIEPLNHFNISDFDLIKQFNSKRVIARLGAATSDIAEQELREIYSSVKNYEKSTNNINRTFVNNQKADYHVNENKNNEGRNDYERDNIQTNGRLSNTTSSITTNKENDTREIFENEREIPKTIQKRSIRGINVRWKNGRTFRRNRGNSSKETETNNQEFSREEPSERRNESNGSNGLGSRNELNTKSSRGNDNDRVNLQLNLFTDSYIPPVKKLPSVKEQINNIQKQAEVENTSAFIFTQEMIDKTLINGSNFSHGKYRIYEQFKRSLSSSENITFLKHEYGIGGSSSAYYGADFGQEHDSKGIRLYKGFGDNKSELLITWNKVEQRLKEIIRLDKYFSLEEKEKYQEWLKNDYENEKWMLDRGLKNDNLIQLDEPENIEKNYKLSNGNYFHFHTNEEGYYYAIYDRYGFEQDGGLLEYSNNEENQTLTDIRKRLAEFTDIEELANENLEEVSQDFIDRLENHEDLDEAIEEVEKTIINNAIDAVNELKEETTSKLKQEKLNYHIDNKLLGEGTPKEKVRRNIEAITLLKKLENENRLANKEEQEILANYVGWGGLPMSSV